MTIEKNVHLTAFDTITLEGLSITTQPAASMQTRSLTLRQVIWLQQGSILPLHGPSEQLSIKGRDVIWTVEGALVGSSLRLVGSNVMMVHSEEFRVTDRFEFRGETFAIGPSGIPDHQRRIQFARHTELNVDEAILLHTVHTSIQDLGVGPFSASRGEHLPRCFVTLSGQWHVRRRLYFRYEQRPCTLTVDGSVRIATAEIHADSLRVPQSGQLVVGSGETSIRTTDIQGLVVIYEHTDRTDPFSILGPSTYMSTELGEEEEEEKESSWFDDFLSLSF